jgi:hypothetical protein
MLTPETKYLPVTYDESIRASASEQGLVVPTIEVADKLVLRLGRTEKTINVDGLEVWGGTRDLEIENPLTVRIDSLPKSDNKARPSRTYISDTHSTLRISSNPTEQLSVRELNKNFWLGILVTDALAEGQRESMEARLSRIRSMGPAVCLASSMIGLGNFATEHIVHLRESGLEQAPVLAAQLSVLGLGLAMSVRNRNKPVTKFLERKNDKQADSLALRHPVLSYGDTVTTS